MYGHHELRLRMMQQRSNPLVCRVGRLLNIWMRRRDPTQVLRGLHRSFPPGKSCSRPLIVSLEKLGTSQFCKLGGQEGFCPGISRQILRGKVGGAA